MTNYTEQSEYPVVAIDALVFNDQGELLLTRRSVEPQLGVWSIIGGRMEVADNNLEETLRREVKEETGLDAEPYELVGVLTELGAEPRFFVVQVIYTARVKGGFLKPTDEANEFRWVKVEDAINEKLAFNHNNILKFYQEKKINSKLIPVKNRQIFSDYFDKELIYTVQNNYPRFATNAIVLNENKEILLASRSQKPFIGYWDFPGGHIFVDETIEQCLIREVREELGVDCEVGELFNVYSDKGHSPKFADAIAFYFVKLKSFDFAKNVEMDDFKYFSLDNLPENIAYHNEGALADIRDYIKKL